MQIREQQDADADAVHRLVEAAFGEREIGDLALALRARGDGGAGFVAERDGRMVGHVQLSRSWVDAPREIVPVLVLSPLAVHPDAQRQGVGRALVAHAVEAARELGAPLVFLEGDPRYYGRLGWERASGHGFTPPSVRIPDPGFQVVVLPAWQPWMTGALVYNDTFWSHDCVGLRPSVT